MQLVLLLLLLVPALANAACNSAVVSSTLPRAGLKMLNYQQCDWHVPIQQTDQILDANAGFLNIPSTWTAKQTFAANPVRLGGVLFDLGTTSLSNLDEWVFRLDPYNATITRIECEAYTGTSFTIKVCKGEDMGDDTCATNLLSTTEATTLACTTGGASITTINSGAVAARDKVTVEITAVSGAVTKGEVYIEGVAR